MPTEITLVCGGPRTKVEVAEAQEVAARFQKEIDQAADDAIVTCVDLSCRSWPLASLECLREVLNSTASTIQQLKIDDIIASLPTEQGLESLAFFADVFGSSPTLTEVNLDDNALGTRGDQVLLPIFHLKTLRILTIENCGMSAEVAASLLTSVADKPLQVLKLGRNQMGDAGAAHVEQLLKQCPTLQVFWYNGSRPLKLGTAHLMQGLAAMADSQSTTQLRELNLHDCTFDLEPAEGMEASSIDNLVTVLKKSPLLQKLNLQDGEIQAEGLQAILDALSPEAITHLSLGGCELTEEGAEILAKYLPAMTNLEELILDTNEFADEGIVALMPALAQAAKLTTLDLECNEITKDGSLAICQNTCPALKSLNVSDNMDIPAQLGAKLASMYETVKIDEDLDEDEDLDDEDLDGLAEQLADTNI